MSIVGASSSFFVGCVFPTSTHSPSKSSRLSQLQACGLPGAYATRDVEKADSPPSPRISYFPCSSLTPLLIISYMRMPP